MSLLQIESEKSYIFLTTDLRNLKQNYIGPPPYAWSDFTEKSKDQAIQSITMSNDSRTSRYWSLAHSTDKCPNWIARWFLYHKFRYRRTSTKAQQNDIGEERQNFATPSNLLSIAHSDYPTSLLSVDHDPYSLYGDFLPDVDFCNTYDFDNTCSNKFMLDTSVLNVSATMAFPSNTPLFNTYNCAASGTRRASSYGLEVYESIWDEHQDALRKGLHI